MPVKRIDKEALQYNPLLKRGGMLSAVRRPLLQSDGKSAVKAKADALSMLEDAGSIYYPVSEKEREDFRTKAGKRLTSHQWAVYDFARTIPPGKVTTYKDVSLAIGGSPRSVGNALRNNPFCPYVPCHRVIASNLFIGGFFGEWGAGDKTGARFHQKVDMLQQEGVSFNQKGNLLSAESVLWRG